MRQRARNKHNTPGIIKYPFRQMTYQNQNAFYACINLGVAFAPQEIKERSISIDGDIVEAQPILRNRVRLHLYSEWRVINTIQYPLLEDNESISSCAIEGQSVSLI